MNKRKSLCLVYVYEYVSDRPDTLCDTLLELPFYGEHVEHRDNLEAQKYYQEYL
jgi:hypothetical protein